MMEKIASFSIDHVKLQPGIYVSRKDKVGDQVITTFDLRMTSPNEEPVMNTAEPVSYTHLMNPDGMIPTPFAVWERFLLLLDKPISGAHIGIHIADSLRRVFMGWLIATLAGVLFGLMLGWNKVFSAVCKPVFEMIRPIPAIA